MLESLVPHILKAFKLSSEAWLAKYPHPAFVVEPFRIGAGGIGTMSTEGPSDGSERSLAWIKKREGANAFGIMVTIGRAKNNDIAISAQDVSKFHAYVRFESDESATLTDAGSSLGTFIGDRTLVPREEKAPLTDGTLVRLGTVVLRYFTPTGLHAHLREDDAA